MLGGTTKELGNAYLRFTIGSKMREIRTAQKRTPCEVAEFLCVSSQEVDEFEQGQSSLSVETMLKACQFLDVSAQDFMANIQPQQDARPSQAAI